MFGGWLNTDFADPEVTGNYIEAVFWIVLGVILWASARKATRPLGGLAVLASGLLVIFGVSDLVEAQTGAWWSPPWLFVWKASCVVALLFCYLKYRRIRKARSKAAQPLSGQSPE